VFKFGDGTKFRSQFALARMDKRQRRAKTLSIFPCPVIDQALREGGWNLSDDRHVRFELDGHSSRADYALRRTLFPVRRCKPAGQTSIPTTPENKRKR